MPIDINCAKFTGDLSKLNGIHQLKCTKAKLFLSALTCGYDSFFAEFRDTWRSRVQHVAGNVEPFLALTPGNELALSEYYFQTDNSEHTQATYFIGQGLTKLFAGKMLSAPLILHASRCVWSPSAIGIVKAPLLKVGRKEPDLFAFGHGAVHVLESKGRSAVDGSGRLSNSVMNAAMRQAIGQVSAVSAVNGTEPISRSGCVWSLCTTGIRGDVEDPIGMGQNADVSVSDILQSNYAIFIEAESGQFLTDLVSGYSLLALPFPEEPGVYVGLLTEILMAIRAAETDLDRIIDLATSAVSLFGRVPGADYQEDGTIVYAAGNEDWFYEAVLPSDPNYAWLPYGKGSNWADEDDKHEHSIAVENKME